MLNIKKQNFVSEEYYNPAPKKYQVPFVVKVIIFLIFLFCLTTYISFIIYKKNLQNNFIINTKNNIVMIDKVNIIDIHSNKTINLNNYKNNKFILLNIWASWCSACMQEMPSLIELSKELDNEVLILALSLDDNIEPVKKYAESIQNKLSIAWNKDKSALSIFNINRYPETFLISPDNKIIKQFSGAVSWDKEKILKYLQ